MTIYEQIKRIRQEKNISQKELAEQLGYDSRSMISLIENGKVDLPVSKIHAFADALGVTPAQLMGLEDRQDAEAKLLEMFRQIPEDEKKLVLEMIRVATKNQQ